MKPLSQMKTCEDWSFAGKFCWKEANRGYPCPGECEKKLEDAMNAPIKTCEDWCFCEIQECPNKPACKAKKLESVMHDPLYKYKSAHGYIQPGCIEGGHTVYMKDGSSVRYSKDDLLHADGCQNWCARWIVLLGLAALLLIIGLLSGCGWVSGDGVADAIEACNKHGGLKLLQARTAGYSSSYTAKCNDGTTISVDKN